MPDIYTNLKWPTQIKNKFNDLGDDWDKNKVKDLLDEIRKTSHMSKELYNDCSDTSIGTYAYALFMGMLLITADLPTRKYDIDHLNVVKIGYHPDDWYLWVLIAPHKDNEKSYDIWTMNLSTLSLNHGYYDTEYQDISEVIKKKIV